MGAALIAAGIAKRSTHPAEREAGLAARDYASKRWPPGMAALVQVVKYDKWGGRDDGHITDSVGSDIATELRNAGVGKSYAGGRRGSPVASP